MKEYIYIDNGKSIRKVALSEIVYIEKVGRKAFITTEDEVITWYRTMDQLKEVTDERFLSCHRSFLINMDKITRMEDRNICMEGGFNVYFGRETFRKAMEIFRGYIACEKNNENED